MNEAALPPDRLTALTGATGFLGSHVADRLLARGWRVRVSMRPTSDRRWLEGKELALQEVPLAPAGDPDAPATEADREALARFVDGATAVVHCAGVVRAGDLAAYYALWEDFSTRRILDSAWFTKSGQYLRFNDPAYLADVTEQDVARSRELLEAVVAKAATPKQKARANLPGRNRAARLQVKGLKELKQASSSPARPP